MSEREERRHNLRGQLTVSSIGHQFVPCTGNWNQLCWAGNHLYRFFHFYNGPEPVSRAVNKECWDLKDGKVLRAQFRRSFRRM